MIFSPLATVNVVAASHTSPLAMLVGDPGYYRRFGFGPATGLTYPGVPPDYFMAVSFGPPLPQGVVSFHDGFAAIA